MSFIKRYSLLYLGFLGIMANISASDPADHVQRLTADKLPSLRKNNAETGEPIIFYSKDCLEESEELFGIIRQVATEIDSQGWLWFKFWAYNIDDPMGTVDKNMESGIPTQ